METYQRLENGLIADNLINGAILNDAMDILGYEPETRDEEYLNAVANLNRALTIIFKRLGVDPNRPTNHAVHYFSREADDGLRPLISLRTQSMLGMVAREHFECQMDVYRKVESKRMKRIVDCCELVMDHASDKRAVALALLPDLSAKIEEATGGTYTLASYINCDGLTEEAHMAVLAVKEEFEGEVDRG